MQRSQGYNNYVLQKVMHDLCVAIAGILYAYIYPNFTGH